jgi:hypothetical protein
VVSNIDDLKLLANLPLYVDNIPIYSPTLKEIAEIGLERYNLLLTYGTITKDRIDESLKNNVRDNYDALIRVINSNQDVLNYILVSFIFFTKVNFTPKIIDNNDIAFVSDNIILHRNNYDQFIKTIKFANMIEDINNEELDEFDRQVMEMERKINEAKNKDLNNPTFKDLVSVVANLDGNGLNIINVWDLNIYQFNEQLQRGMLKDNYKLNIQQLLAGAKPDNIQLESYFKKI